MNKDILVKIINAFIVFIDKIKVFLHIKFDKMDYLSSPNAYSSKFKLGSVVFESIIESAIFNNNIALLKKVNEFSYQSFYMDNAFHLIAKHSKNANFFLAAFDHVLRHSPDNLKEFNLNGYNVIDCLIVNNVNFHSSDLIAVMPRLFTLFDVEEQESTKEYGHVYYFYKDFKTTIFDLKMNSLLNRLRYESVPVEICNYLDLNDRKVKKYPSMTVWSTYRELFESNDLKYICNKLVGSSGKRIKKMYMDRIINGQNMDNIIAFDYVDKLILNYDIKLDLIEKLIDCGFIDLRFKKISKIINVLKESEYSTLINEMSDSNKAKFFIDPFFHWEKNVINPTDFISDTIRMYFELKRKTEAIDEDFQIDLSEFKNVKSLHDWLVIELQKIKVKEFRFDNSKIEYINEINFILDKNKYELKLPKTNHEIIMLGATLHICIGSSHYIDNHFNGKAIIILLYKNDEIFGAIDCIPNETLNIRQAKLYANMYLPDELQKRIQDELTQTKIKS